MQNHVEVGTRQPCNGKRWATVCLLFIAASGADGAPRGKTPVASGPPGAAPATADGLLASPERGWPQWRGPRRDGVSEETSLLRRWPAGGPKLLWKVDGLGRGWSSPIAVDERIYITGDVGDDLMIFAFDVDGTLAWRAKNGKAWKGPYPGARATCAFSEGSLYHLNAHGRLACLDAAAGKERWAVDILERFNAENITWALSECVLVDGTRVIVTPGGKKALMATLDKRNGRTVWITAPRREDRASHASPILFRHAGRRLIANCSSAHGFGVDADSGKLLWTVPLRNQFGVSATTPVYGAGSVFYVTPYSEKGRLYRLRADGQGIAANREWTCPLDTVTGGAILSGDTLVAAGYRRSKWWFGIDWLTGRTKFELKELTTGAATQADGRFYVLDERGRVALVKLGIDGFEIAGRFRLVPGRVGDAWAHPVVHGGRLYLRYHDTLWCYHVKKP